MLNARNISLRGLCAHDEGSTNRSIREFAFDSIPDDEHVRCIQICILHRCIELSLADARIISESLQWSSSIEHEIKNEIKLWLRVASSQPNIHILTGESIKGIAITLVYRRICDIMWREFNFLDIIITKGQPKIAYQCQI